LTWVFQHSLKNMQNQKSLWYLYQSFFSIAEIIRIISYLLRLLKWVIILENWNYRPISLFKKGGIIYHRCLLFIFNNPFIMKVHYTTPDSYITPVCMWNTGRHLIYRRSCRTVLFLLWKLKSRSALKMRELSQFVMRTGTALSLCWLLFY